MCGLDGRSSHQVGIQDDSFYGRTRWELDNTFVDDKLWREHRAQLQAHEVFHNFEIQRRKPSGEWMWVSVSGEPIFDKQGQFAGYRGIGRDITAQKRAEAEIQRLAFYDELTGLPNRRLLMDRLERAVTTKCPQRHSRGLAASGPGQLQGHQRHPGSRMG